MVYHENGKLLHKSLNNTINGAYIVKINNDRYHKDRYIQLKELLKQFTHKELFDFILNKITY